MPVIIWPLFMNETEFQALFDSYLEASGQKKNSPVPQKLHVMVYNYALIRHQQSSDVAGDFYLYVCEKLEGLLHRYDPRRLPFYQYMAANLNFEFNHFLRRRRLPRSQIQLVSVEALAERKIELQSQSNHDLNRLETLLRRLPARSRIYAKLALTFPLTFAEMKQLIASKKKRDPAVHWGTMRGYREFLRFTDGKKRGFITERDRLLKKLMRIEEDIAGNRGIPGTKLIKRREKTIKRFFSIDTRIPIRIVAEVTGDPIATAQRQLKAGLSALKDAYHQWEKQSLLAVKKKKDSQIQEVA